jgi:hypothetical protein
MFFKNPKCPVCRQTLKDFVFDFEGARVICPKCQSTLDAGLIINKSTVNYLAKLIPSDVREQFLSKLGFEKEPVARTPKLALWFLIVIMILGSIVRLLINFPNYLIVVGVALFWRIIHLANLQILQRRRNSKVEEKESSLTIASTLGGLAASGFGIGALPAQVIQIVRI